MQLQHLFAMRQKVRLHQFLFYLQGILQLPRRFLFPWKFFRRLYKVPGGEGNHAPPAASGAGRDTKGRGRGRGAGGRRHDVRRGSICSAAILTGANGYVTYAIDETNRIGGYRTLSE